MTRAGRQRALPLAAFALLAAAFTSPLFSRPMHLGHGDWLWFHFTWDSARRTIVGFHELPWWNPYACGGSLGVANPQSFGFSPLFWLLLPLPTALAMKCYLALCTFLALWGMWELAAWHRARGPFALVAAVLFGCSGTLGWHLNGQTSMAAFAGLPWLALFVLRARRDLRFALAAGGVLATMTLSGGVYPTAFGALLIGALSAFSILESPRAWARMAIAATASLTAFAAFAAVKLAPMLEFLRDHGRPVGRDDAISPSLLLPMLLERRTTETQLWPHVGYIYAWWGEYGNYVGWAGLALITTLAALSGKRGRVALALAALGLALVLGDHGPLSPYAWLRKLPMFSSLRVPTRHWILVDLGLALAVAMGGARLSLTRRRWAPPLYAALLFTSTWVVVDLVQTNGIAIFAGAMQTPPAPRDEPPAPIRQERGEAHAMYRYPPRNLGTLACFDEVTVERSPRLRARLPSELSVEPRGAGVARLVAWSPTSISLDLDLASAARVAVNQNGYRGWRVEGATLEVVEHQLGVRAPPGRHRVRLWYRPRGYEWGVGVTLGAVALSLVVAARALRAWARAGRRSAPAW